MTTASEPYEGVNGTQRADDLLSLEDSAMPHREMLLAMAKMLLRCCLVGNPALVVEKIYQRITSPQEGDLVAETSKAMYSRSEDDRVKGLGVLLKRREEDGDDVWYVQYGPSPRDIARWVDCDFMALPTRDDAFIPSSPVRFPGMPTGNS